MKKFTAEEMQKLERLWIAAKVVAGSGHPGRRTGSSFGHSVDFVDFRTYHPGDDIKYVDWNIYARLRKLILRVFQAESDIDIHILLDASHSMDFGRSNKLDFARTVALSLGYVGLKNTDRVGLAVFSDHFHSVVPPARGRQQLFHLWEHIQQIQPRGRSDLGRCFSDYAVLMPKGGVAVIISDFFDENGYQEGLQHLLAQKFQIAAIQVLDAEELEPAISPEAELHDLETGSSKPLAGGSAVESYKSNLGDFNTSLEGFCHRYDILYLQTLTSIGFEELVLNLLNTGIWSR